MKNYVLVASIIMSGYLIGMSEDTENKITHHYNSSSLPNNLSDTLYCSKKLLNRKNTATQIKLDDISFHQEFASGSLFFLDELACAYLPDNPTLDFAHSDVVASADNCRAVFTGLHTYDNESPWTSKSDYVLVSCPLNEGKPTCISEEHIIGHFKNYKPTPHAITNDGAICTFTLDKLSTDQLYLYFALYKIAAPMYFNGSIVRQRFDNTGNYLALEIASREYGHNNRFYCCNMQKYLDEAKKHQKEKNEE